MKRFVERRRDGKHIYYRLADDHVRELVSAALDHAAED
jgi:ArsR family transcriptional regulator